MREENQKIVKSTVMKKEVIISWLIFFLLSYFLAYFIAPFAKNL